MAVVFFFSSRRRHTRWPRDWSSDVCSSDLAEKREHAENGKRWPRLRLALLIFGVLAFLGTVLFVQTLFVAPQMREIGRASCRERVEISVVAVLLKKEKNNKIVICMNRSQCV